MKNRKMILSCMVAVIMTFVMAVPVIAYGETETAPTDATTVNTEITETDATTVTESEVTTDSETEAVKEEPTETNEDTAAVPEGKAILVLGEGEDGTKVIDDQEDVALYWGATFKAYVNGSTYYYIEESLVPEGAKDVKRIGYSIDFISITPTGVVFDYDRIAVPEGSSVSEFEMVMEYQIDDPSADGYEFLGWYEGVYDDVDENGQVIGLEYGNKLDFDAPINRDIEAFAAWDKEGAGAAVAETSDNDKAVETKAAATEKDHSAKTGDDFNIFVYAAAALGALAVMAVVMITGRRHRA